MLRIKTLQMCVLCLCLLLGPGCSPPASVSSSLAEPTAAQPSATSDQEPEPYPTLVVPSWSNVPYVPDGSAQQRLDVYLPDGDGPFPAILAVHGGGFRAGSKVL